MLVPCARRLAALVFVSVVLSASSYPADAAVVTLEFNGTYDTREQSIFGLSGADVPFSYSLTYDTSLGGAPQFFARGTDPAGDGVLLHDFFGYSGAGIVASHLTFGTKTWSTSALSRIPTGFATADFWLDTDLNTALPSRSFLVFSDPTGRLSLGQGMLGETGIELRTRSQLRPNGLFGVSGNLVITGHVEPEPTVVPEPSTILLVLSGLAMARRRVAICARSRT